MGPGGMRACFQDILEKWHYHITRTQPQHLPDLSVCCLRDWWMDGQVGRWVDGWLDG